MTTERSEAGRCDSCHCKLTGKDMQMANEVNGKILCDDCYDKWADSETPDAA